MNIYIVCAVVFLLLLGLELLYFKIADRCNIVDRPNERSSHSSVVLRGGGIVFTLGVLVWVVYSLLAGNGTVVLSALPFLVGLLLVACVSFVDDVCSLPDSVRLVVQFVAMALLLWNVFGGAVNGVEWWKTVLMLAVALVVCVGAVNIYNFMDGINGITAAYSLAVLIPLMLLDGRWYFMPASLLEFVTVAVLVFCIFNFRPKGKAKCFAGDVGSVGVAFILLFAIGGLVVKTNDASWLVLLMLYGVDGALTIIHRIMLHENLGQAHRKHAYQIMANELGMSHVVVSLVYMGLQMAISLGMMYLVPDTIAAHLGYFGAVLLVLVFAYVLFMRKFYHLHEEYLAAVQSRLSKK